MNRKVDSLSDGADVKGIRYNCMEEISRIIIEEYCISHNTTKSRRLQDLVEMSYDVSAEGTEDDAIFLERAIGREKDSRLRRALEDLDEYLFGY